MTVALLATLGATVVAFVLYPVFAESRRGLEALGDTEREILDLEEKKSRLYAALTDLEQKLLDILSARHSETVDRDEIIAALYDMQADNGNARQYYGRLEALIFRLRGKLEQETQQIESIRGQGYRLVATKG